MDKCSLDILYTALGCASRAVPDEYERYILRYLPGEDSEMMTRLIPHLALLFDNNSDVEYFHGNVSYSLTYLSIDYTIWIDGVIERSEVFSGDRIIRAIYPHGQHPMIPNYT